MTREEVKKWKQQKKKINDSESSVEDDYSSEEKEAPAAIIQQIADENTKVTTHDGVISRMFNINEADIVVIKDKNNDYWYKAKDICNLLQYVNSRDAIKKHVDKEYKKSLADIGVAICDTLKIDPQTIFIDDTGVWFLIARSKKKEAAVLWRKVTKEILPKLFATGTYTLPPKQTDIERLQKSFYDDAYLSDYFNNPVVYFAYIGMYDGKHKLKWGFSTNFARRDLDEHRSDFKLFNVMGIWKTMAYKTVEDKIKINFISKNMVTPLIIKKQIKKGTTTSTKKEIVTLNEINNLDYCLNMIENVVKSTILPQENEYMEKIKELEYENLQIKYESAIKDIKRMEENLNDLRNANNHLTDLVNQLKGNINDLRNKNKLD